MEFKYFAFCFGDCTPLHHPLTFGGWILRVSSNPDQSVWLCLCQVPSRPQGNSGVEAMKKNGAARTAMVALFLGELANVYSFAHGNGSGEWWKMAVFFYEQVYHYYWRGPCLLPWLLGRRVSIVASWIDVRRACTYLYIYIYVLSAMFKTPLIRKLSSVPHQEAKLPLKCV